MTAIKTEQLDDFHINSGLDNYEMNRSYFKDYVEQNLQKSIYLLEKEINHNLLILDIRRLEIYFDQIIKKLENSPFIKFEDSRIDEYVKEYDLDKENILNINNKELISFLRRTGDPFSPINGPDSDLYFKAEKIKNTFYEYTAKHEILSFIDRVKEIKSKHIGKFSESKVKKKVSYANIYGDKLSNFETLAIEHGYFMYYDNILLLHVTLVKEEVQENILKLDTIKIPLYLDKTIEEIENSGFQDMSSTMLNEYIKKYSIDVNLLPEVENTELRKILKTNDYYQKMPYNEFSEIEFIQAQFYRYGLRTETIKLLDYLKGLQVDYQITNNVEIKVPLNFNKTIFKSYETQQWFEDTLEGLNAIDEKKEARSGFQAKANAIFTDINCKKVIFKYNILLKDYIAFLNKVYKAGVKAKDKLSDGLNHSTAVEDLIQLYEKP
jgi:hypothetical protein